MARQRVTAEFRGRERSFEAVLQYDGTTLVLLGLAPMGTKAFVVQQRDAEVTAQVSSGFQLPFDPRFMLLDVHRTFLLAPPSKPLPDGRHEYEAAQAHVTEIWRGGLLHGREVRAAGTDRLEIVYEGGWRPDGAWPKAALHHTGFGYRLAIETFEHRLLPTKR